MLLLGKVILAEPFAAIGAMPKRLLVTFLTTPGGRYGTVAVRLLLRAIYVIVSHMVYPFNLVTSSYWVELWNVAKE